MCVCVQLDLRKSAWSVQVISNKRDRIDLCRIVLAFVLARDEETRQDCTPAVMNFDSNFVFGDKRRRPSDRSLEVRWHR